MRPSSPTSVEASGSIFCGEAASQIVYPSPSSAGSRPSAATCSARVFFTRPKIATPIASLPSTAEREALVTCRLPLSAACSSEATVPSAEAEEVVVVESPPPSSPPPNRTKTTNKTTIAAPAKSAQSPRPSRSLISLRKGGLGSPLGSAGGVSLGCATSGRCGSGGAGGGVGGASPSFATEGEAPPPGGSGIEGAVIPSASKAAPASLARLYTSAALIPIRAERSSYPCSPR